MKVILVTAVGMGTAALSLAASANVAGRQQSMLPTNILGDDVLVLAPSPREWSSDSQLRCPPGSATHASHSDDNLQEHRELECDALRTAHETANGSNETSISVRDHETRKQNLGASPQAERDVGAITANSQELAPVGAGLPLSKLLPSFPDDTQAAPKRSDVILSPRFERPDLLDAIRAYRPTRLEWSYIRAPNVIAKLKAVVPGHFGATINNNAPTPNNAGAALDIDGNPIVAPWMRAWGATWNSCARPAGMQALKDAAASALALGADSLQLDDPGMQLESEYFGAGDFSPENMNGFAKWVREQNSSGVVTPISPQEAARYGQWLKAEGGIKDASEYHKKRASIPSAATFRKYMRASVTKCLNELKNSLSASKQTTVPLSLNIHTPFPWGPNAFLVPLADYVVGEVDDKFNEYHHLYLFNQWLRSEGKRWVPVYPSSDRDQLRRAIITSYAIGATPMIPWDVWVPPQPGNATPQPRFFGNPSDFVDLFSFARRNARLLDGYEVISRLNLFVDPDQKNPVESLAQLKRLADMQVSYLPVLRAGDRKVPTARNDSIANRTLQLSGKVVSSDDGIRSVAAESNERLQTLSSGEVSPSDYRMLVTANPTAPDTRVVHVFRQNGAANGESVKVTLQEWTLPQGKAMRVTVLSPQALNESKPKRLKRSSDSTLKLEIDGSAEWTIIKVEPAD